METQRITHRGYTLLPVVYVRIRTLIWNLNRPGSFYRSLPRGLRTLLSRARAVLHVESHWTGS